MSIVIDDTNSKIRYLGTGWYPQTGISGEYNLTRHGVSTTWQTVVANVEFDFIGSSVEVYGSLDISGTLGGPMGYSALFSVDNGPSTAFSPQIATILLHGIQFYKSPLPLSDGEHTLRIAISIPPPLGATFWLDSIRYTPVSKAFPTNLPHIPDTIVPGNPTTTAVTIQSTTSETTVTSRLTSSELIVPITTTIISGSSVASSSLSQSSSSNPILPGSMTLSQEGSPTEMPLITSSSFASTSAPAAGSGSKTSTGPIVGAVIGGVFLCFIVASLLYCWRRKPKPIPSRESNSTTIVPYMRTSSSPRPEKAARRASIFLGNDSPPPWSPSESSEMQGVTTSLLASNTLVGHTPRHSLISPTRYYPIPERSKAQHGMGEAV